MITFSTLLLQLLILVLLLVSTVCVALVGCHQHRRHQIEMPKACDVPCSLYRWFTDHPWWRYGEFYTPRLESPRTDKLNEGFLIAAPDVWCRKSGEDQVFWGEEFQDNVLQILQGSGGAYWGLEPSRWPVESEVLTYWGSPLWAEAGKGWHKLHWKIYDADDRQRDLKSGGG